jgi:hypothetical protein
LTADPAGFDGLARDLARSGILAVTVEVRAAGEDVVCPVPVGDVICAVAHSVAWARSNWFELSLVAVLGHSSGAPAPKVSQTWSAARLATSTNRSSFPVQARVTAAWSMWP